MRIGHRGPGVGEVDERKVAERKGAGSSGRSSEVAPGVVVSAKAREIGEAVAAEKSARAERLAALRAAVSEGRYKVDFERAANRFYEDEVEGKPR